MKQVKILAFLLGIAASTLVLGAKDEWMNLGPSDFPARVAAMVFATGAVMNNSKTVTWGRWSVALDERTVATYSTGALVRITIEPLICSNEVAGKHKCVMVFDREGRTWNCAILGDALAQINIVCPTELRLQ